MVKTPSYGLGAIELLELGRPLPAHVLGRRPFFADRPRRPQMISGRRPELGQFEFLAQVGYAIVSGLEFTLNLLADFLEVPLQIISQGVDLVFNGVADLLTNIPGIGDLLSQIVLLGGTVIKFALEVPVLLLRGLGNVLGGIGDALKATFSDRENGSLIDGAKTMILEKAPEAIKTQVKKLLDGSGVSGRNLTPGIGGDGTVTGAAGQGAEGAAAGRQDMEDTLTNGAGSDLEGILKIGVPVAAGAVLLAIIVS